MKSVFILYKQNPSYWYRERREKKKRKGKGRRKKGKSSIVTFLHPLRGGARFIESINEMEKKKKEKEEAKMEKCSIETWRIRHIFHTHTHILSYSTRVLWLFRRVGASEIRSNIVMNVVRVFVRSRERYQYLSQDICRMDSMVMKTFLNFLTYWSELILWGCITAQAVTTFSVDWCYVSRISYVSLFIN